VLLGFVADGEAIIFSNARDDRAGGVFMGALIGLASIAVALAASRLERLPGPASGGSA